MTRFLLAGALAAGALFAATPAHACTLDTCPWAQPVCERIDCRHPVCFETAEISYCR
jgi:hypothetical protein